MASRLWQAVTPDPQYITASAGARPPSTCVNAARSASAPEHRAVGRQVVLEEAVVRTRDMARDLVDGLRPPFESLRGARVHEHGAAVLAAPLDVVDRDVHIAVERRAEDGARPYLQAGAHRPALGRPLREAAVEHRHRGVPGVAQQPPEAARVDPGVLVVGDHLRGVADAQPFQGGDEGVVRRQRVAAVRSGARAGEVVVEARVDGAGNVRRGVLLAAPRVVGEVEAAVHHRPVARVRRREGLGRDESRVDHGVTCPPNRRRRPS